MDRNIAAKGRMARDLMVSSRVAVAGDLCFTVQGSNNIYVVNNKGWISTEQIDWIPSRSWVFSGVSFHNMRNGIDTAFDPRTNPQDYVGGYVWDLDHGSIRRWGKKITRAWRDTAEMASRREWNSQFNAADLTMNRNLVAKELLAVARDLMAMDFPTQDAMDKYLKEHPDADKSNHRVLEQKEKESAPVETKREGYDLSSHVRDLVTSPTRKHGISHGELVKILGKFGNSKADIAKELKSLQEEGYMNKGKDGRWRWNASGKFSQ